MYTSSLAVVSSQGGGPCFILIFLSLYFFYYKRLVSFRSGDRTETVRWFIGKPSQYRKKGYPFSKDHLVEQRLNY